MENTIKRKTLLVVFVSIMGTLTLLSIIGQIMNPTDEKLFGDFFLVLTWIADKNPYSDSLASIYLPLCYLILYPFSFLNDYASISLDDAWNSEIGMLSAFFFSIFSLIFLYFSLYKLGKKPKSTLMISGFLFFSSMNQLAITTGNFIILSAAFVSAFLWLYDSPKKEYRALSLIFLSIAAVLKIYPALFGLLLVFDKKYKSLAFCVIFGLALTFLPFLFFDPGFFENIQQLLTNLQEFVGSGSRWGLPTLMAKVVDSTTLPIICVDISRYLQLLLIAVSIILCFFTQNTWLKIAIVSIVVVITPHVAWHFCGLYFFPAIILFFNKQTFTKKDLLYTLLFCIFLNPFQILHNLWALNNVALLLIWVLLVFDILKENEQVFYTKISRD
jgi:hypothetical protein